MRALDTNILLRLFHLENPAQAQASHDLAQDEFFIPLTVLLELAWVLTSRIGYSREDASASMRLVLRMKNACSDDRSGAEWAIERFEAGADLADMLHLVACRNDVTDFLTFDHKLARQAGSKTPVNIQTVEA